MLDEIERFQPEILTAHPVYLAYLDDWCRKKGIAHPKVNEVSLSYDFSSNIHKRIAKRWARKTVSVSYGLTEVFTVSIECEHGTGHVVTDDLFLEVLRDKRPTVLNEIGEIVVTSSRNPVMPLLRYRTGDLSSLVSYGDTCGCGRRGIELGRIEGRINELTLAGDGALISTAMIDDIVSSVDGVMLYQVEQNDDESVVIKMVPDERFTGEKKLQLKESLMALYKSNKVDLVEVPEVTATWTGKYPVVLRSGLSDPATQVNVREFSSQSHR